MTLMGTASEFMGDTLNDVLAMHQIEEGTFRMRRAPFVVSDLIAGALSGQLHYITSHHITSHPLIHLLFVV